MSIDWITVGAQIVNFLVLIWLLKRFLYRPILDGIDAREAEIAARMGEAEILRKAAQAKELKYMDEIRTLSSSRADMLAETRAAAQVERDEMLADARSLILSEQTKRDDNRAEEARRYTAKLHHDGAKTLLALTGKALVDLADETLEERIVARAVAQLAGIADKLRTATGDNRDATALTQCPLSSTAQNKLRKKIGAVLPEFKLTFKTDPALSAGLTLRLGGAQVGWTIDSYMAGLDQALEDQTAHNKRDMRHVA